MINHVGEVCGLPAVDARALVHALIPLRALVLPFKVLVFSGH